MNRRSFFTKLAGGIAGAVVISKLPVSWVPTEVRKQAASTFLTHEWRRFMNGRKGSPAAEGYATADLYDAFESELVPMQRFVWVEPGKPDVPRLMFRNARLFRKDTPGWAVTWNIA